MAKELERAGLPTVMITAMSPLAQSIGANRIVWGKAVPNPFGNPDLTTDEERAFRRRIVERALEALCSAVAQPTVFEVRD